MSAPASLCACMTEDPGDGFGERVVTHSLRCLLHPEYEELVMTTKTFAELAPGDTVVEKMADGTVERRKYLGGNAFERLTAPNVGLVEADEYDPWDTVETEES